MHRHTRKRPMVESFPLKCLNYTSPFSSNRTTWVPRRTDSGDKLPKILDVSCSWIETAFRSESSKIIMLLVFAKLCDWVSSLTGSSESMTDWTLLKTDWLHRYDIFDRSIWPWKPVRPGVPAYTSPESKPLSKKPHITGSVAIPLREFPHIHWSIFPPFLLL